MDRVAALQRQLAPAPALGELSNQTTEDRIGRPQSASGLLRHRFQRLPIKIWFQEEELFKTRYGGALGIIVLEGELLRPPTESETVSVFMHPSGIQNLLPMPMAMARAGLHVVTCTSRNPNNDSALIMESVVLDLAACIRHCKTKLGYKKVVLAGWSGGGALSAFYQSQAEHPTVTCTPAGDGPDLTKAELIPADGLMALAAHTARATQISRAKIMTEWLDPAVIDERDPTVRIVDLDLFDPRNPNKPPFTEAYVARFRAAQVARNRRITAWVKDELAEIRKRDDEELEKCFIVYGTMADPRNFDMTLEPNGRRGPNWCFLGLPKMVNNGPVGVARFCTLRSWLSQWSYDDSNADACAHLARISVPVMVLGNSDDDAVPPSHTEKLFAAVKHSDKELYIVEGANHYYAGQPDKQEAACRIVIDWMNRKGLLVPPLAVDAPSPSS